MRSPVVGPELRAARFCLLSYVCASMPSVIRVLAIILVVGLSATGQKERYFPDNAKPDLEEVGGHRAFFLISPNAPASERPWVWFAPVLLSNPAQPPNSDIAWTFRQLLDDGISIAGVDVGESYGSPRGSEIFDAFYSKTVSAARWSKKPCFLAQSRGGLMAFNWAIAHPDSVACVAGIYPVVNIKSWPVDTTKKHRLKH